MTASPIQRFAMALCTSAALAAWLSGCVPLAVGGAAAVGAGMVATDRRTSGVQLDDQTIELRGMARIREIANDRMSVSVTSFNRQVLLTGSAGSEADRRRAEDAIRRMDNVRAVVNELQVGPAATLMQRSNDAAITGLVKTSLVNGSDIFGTLFKVITERNTVYLMGLATRGELDRATEITRKVSGVEKVVRVVEVIPEAALKDGALPGGTGAPSEAATPGAKVPLPPMEPLPPAGTPPGAESGGVVTYPVR